MISSTQKNTAIQGALLATTSALLTSILMAIAKALPPAIPSSLLLFIRSLFILIFSLPLWVRNPQQALKSDQYILHGLQVLLGICATLCTYYTYRTLPVTLATSLGMTGALFTTVLSILILKDNVDFIKWMCILVGYSGALLIIQPQRISLEVGILTALLANLLAGFGAIISKILSQRVDKSAIIVYNTVGLAVFFGFLSYPHWYLLNHHTLWTLAGMGALSLGSKYCYLTALKKATPSFLAPFEYTRLLFAFLIGLLCFHELPKLYTLIGSVLIIGATYVITYRSKYKE